ncbi:MAG: AAA family ATPase [Oscillospiraceae bacterium]|nr:AAA family ATPase [Oscillospiraceae bacterium]
MDIMVSHVRIKNFRSLENVDVKLGINNILIGQNNVGKSNFLKAIDIAFNGSKTLTEDDIFVEKDERLSKDKKAIIDIKIVPSNNNKEFSDFWNGIFTENWITVDETNVNYVGIRTIIEYDVLRNDYYIVRKNISEWNESIDSSKADKRQSFNNAMVEYLNSFYMDAKRDIIDDLKDRKSYFGRVTSKIDLEEDKIQELEGKLNDINQEIIDNIEVIGETKNNLSKISNTLGNEDNSINIEPISRKISDLHKGIDITYRDGEAAAFSVSQHGMGTRSWISFLTLGAYVNYYRNTIKKDDSEADSFVILSLEEPEAHLHPQAQRHIYKQLTDFAGQNIVSTHSSSVLAQTDLESIIQFKKENGKTIVKRFNTDIYQPHELKKIRREVIRTHGELIFSNAIILCEGITEEQALPVYFEEFFGIEPLFCGINIAGIGGQNYKTYLKFIKELELKWYIFSDGEHETIKTIIRAIQEIGDKGIDEYPNIVVLDNENDFEKMIINSVDNDLIISSINEEHGDQDYFKNYKERYNQKPDSKRIKTSEICPECRQNIYIDAPIEVNGLNHDQMILYKCMTKKDKEGGGKARYAIPTAEAVVNQSNIKSRFPKPILKLLLQLESDLNLKRREIYNDLTII